MLWRMSHYTTYMLTHTRTTTYIMTHTRTHHVVTHVALCYIYADTYEDASEFDSRWLDSTHIRMRTRTTCMRTHTRAHVSQVSSDFVMHQVHKRVRASMHELNARTRDIRRAWRRRGGVEERRRRRGRWGSFGVRCSWHQGTLRCSEG